MCDATLHANPQWKPDGEGHRSGADEDEVPFHCPIASVPMNGRNKFAFLRASGHVVSERALAQLGGKTCPVTEQPLGPDDVVPLNGTDEQRAELAEKLEAKKAAPKEAKEARRKGKAAAAAAGGAAAAASSAAGAGDADDGAGATAAAPARPPKDKAASRRRRRRSARRRARRPPSAVASGDGAATGGGRLDGGEGGGGGGAEVGGVCGVQVDVHDEGRIARGGGEGRQELRGERHPNEPQLVVVTWASNWLVAV